MKLIASVFLGTCLGILSFVAGIETHNAIYLEKVSFSKVKPIFKNRCSLCHNANSGRGDWTDYDQAYKKRNHILYRVRTGNMPPGNVTKMTLKEKEEIIKWVERGAKK